MEYEEIAERLGLDREGDRKAAELLDSLVGEAAKLDFIKDRAVIVCGAGPSLRKDLGRIKKINTEDLVFIAADGAAEALLEEGIVPAIVVSDLDGRREAIEEADRLGAVIVAHAHADNIEAIKKIVPHLSNVLGTTQTKAFGKLFNFGGFTDGDRATYLAEHFKAKIIGLMGMDFGERIGEYSGSRDHRYTAKKLEIGKKLIEELAEKTRTYNMTSGGEDIKGARRVTPLEFRDLAKEKLKNTLSKS